MLFATVCACDAVFGFRVPMIDGGLVSCPLPMPIGSTGDRDGDMAVDAEDNCPDHANVDQNDEDGDGLGDACDPCPLAAVVEPVDGDCDDLGMGCDPDDALPHLRTFFGFGSANGLTLGGGAAFSAGVEDGAFAITQNAELDRYGFVTLNPEVTTRGIYETRYAWTIAPDYFDMQLTFGHGAPAGSTAYRAQLLRVTASGPGRLWLRRASDGLGLRVVDLPPLTPGTYTLRVTVTDARITIDATGPGVEGTLEYDVAELTEPFPERGQIELRAHNVDAAFAYVQHVALEPPSEP